MRNDNNALKYNNTIIKREFGYIYREPQITFQRAECDSRAAGWVPLVYATDIFLEERLHACDFEPVRHQNKIPLIKKCNILTLCKGLISRNKLIEGGEAILDLEID